MPKKSLTLFSVALLLLAIGGALFFYGMYIYVNSDKSAILLTSPAIPPIAAFFFAAAGTLTLTRNSDFLRAITISTLILYLLSARSLRVDIHGSQISEDWFGFSIRTHTLEGIDDHPYCVSSNLWFIHIKSEQDKKGMVYFRGMWPVYLDDKMIDSELKFMKRCRT